MDIEQALQEVIAGRDEVLVKCRDTKERNVLRTTVFRLRSRLESGMLKSSVRNIGISNEDIDGTLFIRIYNKPALEMYARDENNQLVKLEIQQSGDTENVRLLQLMLSDGVPEEKILSDMTSIYGMEMERVIELLSIERDKKLEQNSVIPQDIEKREKLNKEDL